MKIEMLNNSNYHRWKIRIEHVLILKDLENFLYDDQPSYDTSTDAQIALRKKKDKKAQAIIGLSLSNELLENMRDATFTKDMWISIKNVFERYTLLSKLSARKKFYATTMSPDESVLQFSNRIRKLSATP